MFKLGKKKQETIPYVDPTVAALESARDLIDQVNNLYQSPNWPRSHRLWFDLNTRPPRLTLQTWQPSSAAEIVYPAPDLRTSR